MFPKFFRAFSRMGLCASLALMLVTSADGENTSSMTQSELTSVLDPLLREGDFLSARPYLQELVDRFAGAEEPPDMEPIFFYLGVSYLGEYSVNPGPQPLQQGAVWFERIREEFPNGDFIVQASMALADCYRGQRQFAEAAEVYKSLLRIPLSGRLTPGERDKALQRVSECYYFLKDWERGVPMFRLYFDESKGAAKSQATTMLMESLLGLERFGEIFELLPHLGKNTPARYNIRFNLALLQGGDLLFEAERGREAMLLYRLVLTREEIEAWFSRHVAELNRQLEYYERFETEAARSTASGIRQELAQAEAQLEAVASIQPYSEDLRVRTARNYVDSGRKWEAYWIFLELIDSFPQSRFIEQYYYSAFSTAVELELLESATELANAYLEQPLWLEFASDISLRLIQVNLDSGRFEETIAVGSQYVEGKPAGLEAMQVTHLLGQAYQQAGRFNELLSQFGIWAERYEKYKLSEAANHWRGITYLVLGDYERAKELFAIVMEKFPDGIFASDALYRHGVANYGLADNEGARADFKKFIEKYPDGVQRGEVEFFLGELEAGEGNARVALTHFRNVEQYTDSMEYITSAYFSMGEIFEANRVYEAMQENFATFIDRFGDRADVSKAIFELGRAWDFLNRPDKMIDAYIDAIVRFGDNPREYGVDAILDTYLDTYESSLEKLVETIKFLAQVYKDESFRERILQDRRYLTNWFAANPRIDRRVREKFYSRDFRGSVERDLSVLKEELDFYFEVKDLYPSAQPLEKLKVVFDEAKATDRVTLRLRVQRALAQAGADPDPGAAFTESDLLKASPATLVWIAEKAREYDPELAEAAYNTILEDHPEADSVLMVFLDRGRLRMANGDLAGALADFEEAERQFSTDPDISEALFLKGICMRNLGQFEQAEAVFEDILNRREWRGIRHARALLQVGLTRRAAGNLKGAHAYFERLFIGYIGFPEFAAEGYFNAGVVLREMGEHESATKTFKEALSQPALEGTEGFEKIREAML